MPAPLADGTPIEIVIAPEGIPTQSTDWHVSCNSSCIMDSTALAISFLESLHPRMHLLLYLLAFWLLYRTRILHAIVGAADVVLGRRLSKGLTLVSARYAEVGGDWARAGQLHEERWNPHRAIECFELAGEAFENAEQFEQAAECFEKTLHEAGDLQSLTTTTAERESAARASLRAAECYKRAGKPARALDVLAKGQHHELAANTAERLGDYRGAARLYQDSGNRKKAAAMYTLAGEPLAALRVEAEHHLEMGRHRAGAECLRRAGDSERAAEVFQSLGEI